MRLIITMYFRMQTDKAHEERCPRAGMTEDKEFFAREELFYLGDFFGRDDRDEIAAFLFGVAFRRMRVALLKRENIIRISPNYLFQFSITNPARQTNIPK